MSAGHHVAKRQPAHLLAVAIAAGGLVLGGIVWCQQRSAEAAVSRAETVTEAADTTPTFQTTPEQWAGSGLAEVTTLSFESAKSTDGQITMDDDLNAPVVSPCSGRATRVIARLGDVVKAGEPLFAIKATEFLQAQNDPNAAVAMLRTTRAQLRMALATEQRAHGLYGAQAGSLKDWQQGQLVLATAQGGAESASIALAAVRGRLRILGQTDEKTAALEEHSEQVTARPGIDMLAPIGGTVIQRQIGVGQYIGSAANGASVPACTIGDLSKVWLIANVREVGAGSIHVGDHVPVHVSAFPERTFTARVSYVAPAIDPTTRRLPVRAEIDNHDLALKPQMVGSFSIVTGAATVSAAVPERGVAYEDTNAYVWVAVPDEKTREMRRVHTDHVTNGMAEVTEGLKPSERLVTRGAVFIDRPTGTD